QAEIRVGVSARRHRLELDEQIEVAALWVKTTRDGRPEETEPAHMELAAEIAKWLGGAVGSQNICWGIARGHGRECNTSRIGPSRRARLTSPRPPPGASLTGRAHGPRGCERPDRSARAGG